ncbi:hypothetical protein ACFFRR_006625 [Megaselia abdita]
MENLEEYNEDELVAPEWLNEEFFEKILNETEREKNVKVKSIDVKPGSKKGDHYASVMFRIKIDCVGFEKTVIVKVMPFVDGPKKDSLDVSLFETEISMYTEIIPDFEETLREAGDNTVIGGKCVYAALKPHPIIIFEDLTQQNYKSVSNWGGDWEITKKAIQKLGRWHALSYKSFKDGNNDLQKFSSNFFSGDKMIEFPPFGSAYTNFLEMLKGTKEFYPYVEKFEKIAQNEPLVKVQNIYKAFFNGEKANLFVLTHSDFHIKNFMILENEAGEVQDVKLIDFQLCIFAPAIIDLIYLIYMTLDSESRIHRRNEIIHYYYEVFLKTLEKLKFEGEIPKLTDIYKDMITFKDFEIFMLITSLPMVFSFQEGNSKVGDEAFNDSDKMKEFYRNPIYIEYLKKVLPSFLQQGFLD